MLYFLPVFSTLILQTKINEYNNLNSDLIAYLLTFYFYMIFSKILIHTLYQFSITDINTLFFVLVKMHFNTYLTDSYLFVSYLELFTLLILIQFEIFYYFFFGGNNSI